MCGGSWRDAYTLKRAHSHAVGCYWNVIIHGNNIDLIRLLQTHIIKIVDHSPL